MRSLRSHPVDDRTAALARARVAQLAGTGDSRPRRSAARGRRRARVPDDDWRPEHAGPSDPAEPAPWDQPAPGDDPADGSTPGGEARPPEWLDALHDRLPPAIRPARIGRLGLERTHLAIIVLVVLVGVIGATVLFLLARPEVVPVEPEVLATDTPIATGTAPPSAEAEADATEPPPESPAAIVVHVAGLVARPGVIELPAGSRVVDAIEAAGGATPDADLTPLNLARILTDGEQVLVSADPPPPVAPPVGTTTQPPAGPVNLNIATAADLETLPGIGPALAGRILEWRTQNGRFTTIDELREVSGIGEQRFAELEPLVTV